MATSVVPVRRVAVVVQGEVPRAPLRLRELVVAQIQPRGAEPLARAVAEAAEVVAVAAAHRSSR